MSDIICHVYYLNHLYILIVSSQTTRSVGAKLGRNAHWMFLFVKKVCLFVCLLLNENAQQNKENQGGRKWRFLFLYMERLVFNYSLFSVCSLYNSLYFSWFLLFLRYKGSRWEQHSEFDFEFWPFFFYIPYIFCMHFSNRFRSSDFRDKRSWREPQGANTQKW